MHGLVFEDQSVWREEQNKFVQGHSVTELCMVNKVSMVIMVMVSMAIMVIVVIMAVIVVMFVMAWVAKASWP